MAELLALADRLAGWPLRSETSGLVDAQEEATTYANATGHQLDGVAVDFFSLTWDLADLAAFTTVLRSPHRHSKDTVKAYDGLRKCVTTQDQWAALLE